MRRWLRKKHSHTEIPSLAIQYNKLLECSYPFRRLEKFPKCATLFTMARGYDVFESAWNEHILAPENISTAL